MTWQPTTRCSGPTVTSFISARGLRVVSAWYIGTNPEADFASIANDPTTKNKWWPLTDACQVILKGTPTGQHWLPIEQVMHLD